MRKLYYIIPLVLCMLCQPDVCGSESTGLLKKKTPWQKMMRVLYEHGVDTIGMGVTTLVEVDVLSAAAPDLAKAFGVKCEPVQAYTKQELVGDVVCQYMQLKYTKQNEKHLYYRTRYSTDEDAYAEFIKAYPDSRYADEMLWKMNCIKAYWSWMTAMTEEACNLAYLHSRIVDNTPYVAFVPEYHYIVECSGTVEDWKLLMQTRANEGYTDCDAFMRFKQDHTGHLTGYNFFIDDSIRNCEDNQAWKVAKELNTIAAYRDYLSSYPAGEYADEVKRKIQDYESWADACEKGHYDAYSQYVFLHPLGDSVAVAKKCMRKIEEEEWNRIKHSKNWRDFHDYELKYPDGIYAAQAEEKMGDILNVQEVNMNELFSIVGLCAANDSGIVFLSNVNRGKDDISFDFYSTSNGKKRLVLSKTLRPGEFIHYNLRNGRYEVKIRNAGMKMPKFGFMDISSSIYSLQYYIFPTWASSLKAEDREKKYSNAEFSEKASAEENRISCVEQLKLKAFHSSDVILKKGVLVIFPDGFVDLNNTPAEKITGELLVQSKEVYCGLVEKDPDLTQLFLNAGCARLGLQVVLKSSISDKAEIVDFSANEVKAFARRLENQSGNSK